MNRAAREALKEIQDCIDAGRVVVLAHFVERMDLRGLFWTDIADVIESPVDVRDGGPEELGRPKWIVAGALTDGLKIGIVCVIDGEESMRSTVSITLYFQD